MLQRGIGLRTQNRTGNALRQQFIAIPQGHVTDACGTSARWLKTGALHTFRARRGGSPGKRAGPHGCTGGVAPYGFQFIDGRRAWHQGEQETLAAIIEHRGAGLSWAKVADKLNATGHRTRTGGQWTRQGAHQVHQARERDDQAAA